MTTEFSQEQLEAIEVVLQGMNLPSFKLWQQGGWCMIDDEVAYSPNGFVQHLAETDTRKHLPWNPYTTPEHQVMQDAAVSHAARLPDPEGGPRMVTEYDLAMARR